MTRYSTHFFTIALLVSSITGCVSGGEEGSSGGVGGSGIHARGTITGFGSIFVNGTEYDTDAATVEVKEQSAGAADLKLGMVVTVGGKLNSDGVSGTADSVVADDILRGPVADVEAPDTDNVTRSIEILGVTVLLDRNETVFSGTTFETVAVGDLMEVSGFPTAAGLIQATRVQRTGATVPGSSEVKLSGTVSGYVTDTSFMLGAILITLDAGTQIEGPPLANGQSVEAEGIILAGLMTILASEIEPEDDGLPDDADEVEIEGIVTEFSSLSNFRIADITVNASTAEFEPATLAATLAVGDRVEVEGDIQSGVLVAKEVKGRRGKIAIEAFVNSVSTMAGQVTLELAPGQLVSINTTPSTIFKDDRDGAPGFGLDGLTMGDYVLIRADRTTSVIANEIKRKGVEDKIKVTAVVDSVNAMTGTITLLGVTFNTNGSTEYERDDDAGDLSITASQFFNDAAVMAGTAVITLKDELNLPATVGDGVAKEVEIKD